ncbi:Coenzyme F420 hydrogenase/dehydrogenase, beta subunit C-terminal domain [Rothia sp. P7181]|uniref:Coenzyme F420 hydrogenase/dehydrogenase, beta subunit C-terminal domain n=1 Tax=Rothia sp. P7181 TaxID=3402663 RepID=UPI003AE9CF31
MNSQMCTGCGLCAAMSSNIQMKYVNGFMRPVFSESACIEDKDHEKAKTFSVACPGRRVQAIKTPEAERHETLGPIIGIWQAWAVDPEFRDKGSSGGTLSALNAWLLSRGIATKVVGASASRENPRKTVPVTILSREEALASAGSRYAPTSNLSNSDAFLQGVSFTGKPCEVSAKRAYDKANGQNSPILLSFFCAGTPSQDATDNLIEKLGISKETPLQSLWYRGHGWPGEFTAISKDGNKVSTSYNDSWGAALGPTVQWRCRICPDGVGESADITAGDFWEADEKGYPEFSDKPGRSALIARTPRGYQLIQEAIKEGILEAIATDPDTVAKMQPYQYSRRKYLIARILGSRIFLGKTPKIVGFGMYRILWKEPKTVYKEMRGTISRIRHRKRSGIKS